MFSARRTARVAGPASAYLGQEEDPEMTGMMRKLALTVGVVAGLTVAAHADEALDAAKADIVATLGPNAIELSVFPDAFLASTWAQNRAWLIDNKATIPPKYRALIGLAVSSQIPCAYCIYADTSDARVFGATDEEIKEAIMFAAMTRQGSAIMNGNMVDLDEFKKAIDAGAAAMREAMKAETAAK
jgi:AhpD family alkylhydroperoxidase